MLLRDQSSLHCLLLPNLDINTTLTWEVKKREAGYTLGRSPIYGRANTEMNNHLPSHL